MATTFELTADTAKSIILSRSIISEKEGDMQVINCEVTSSNWNAEYKKTFVSFNVTTHQQMENAISAWKDGNLQDATNTNLTLGLFENQVAPQKGDIVKLVVKRVPLRDGGTDFRPQRVIVKGTSDTESGKDNYASAFED